MAQRLFLAIFITIALSGLAEARGGHGGHGGRGHGGRSGRSGVNAHSGNFFLHQGKLFRQQGNAVHNCQYSAQWGCTSR